MSVNTAPIIALDNVSREFQAGSRKLRSSSAFP